LQEIWTLKEMKGKTSTFWPPKLDPSTNYDNPICKLSQFSGLAVGFSEPIPSSKQLNPPIHLREISTLRI
jgi:hypothetical protein